MNKTKLMLLISLITTSILSSCTQDKKPSENLEENVSKKALSVDAKGLSHKQALLKTVHGNIVFKFYPKEAPNTVTRIIELIEQGFYDNLVFHRVVQNFVVQTGDPTATGRGGSGKKLKAEFNSIQHIKGTVAMARAGNDFDSADSQFYIALSTLPHLDKQYTVFGQVVEGLEILEKISQGDKILSLSVKN